MNSKTVKAQQIYTEYLEWFNRLCQTPEGIQELRDRKAFSKYADLQAAVEPYPFQLWYLYDKNSGVDETAMSRRADTLRRKNSYNISEANKHVGGNPANPLLNPEYVARAEATKKLREQYKTYSGSDEVAKDVLFGLRKEHGDLLKLAKAPEERPIYNSQIVKRPNWFKRIWGRLMGGQPELRQPMSYMERQDYERNLK